MLYFPHIFPTPVKEIGLQLAGVKLLMMLCS